MTSITNSPGPRVCPVDVTLRPLPLFARTLCHYSSCIDRWATSKADETISEVVPGLARMQDFLIPYLMTVSVWVQIDKGHYQKLCPESH